MRITRSRRLHCLTQLNLLSFKFCKGKKHCLRFKVECREIEQIKKVEHLKQDLINQFDYSILSIFRCIDQFAHGKITKDNLRTFLLNFD